MAMRVLTWNLFHGRSKGAGARMALRSRNVLPPLQRVIAEPRPHLVKSWAGGCNAILVRGQAIVEHRSMLLRLLPERRVVHGVRLAEGPWVSNVHAQVHVGRFAQADLDLAAEATTAWAAGAPALLGGDFNLRGAPTAFGYAHLAGHWVDHVLGRGFRVVEKGRTL